MKNYYLQNIFYLLEKLKSEKGQLEKAIKDLHDNIEKEFQGEINISDFYGAHIFIKM